MAGVSSLSVPAVPDAAAELLRAYEPAAGAYDELLASDGGVRAHWRTVLDGFAAMGGADRARILETAQRMLRENGVTFIARDDPERMGRPWQLDLFPLLIDHREWRRLETGLIQRARLLNAILEDLYGPQRLLREGGLPPALVYGSPQFLLPCHGISIPDGIHLHLIAFDLARSADGQWWVVSDRAQAPSGVGYALENRLIGSRCLPDLFASSNVQRLASFFRGFSDFFLATSRRDEPLPVVLSPGPTKENYFEHAYLARYLGYTMVEGSDLTVRDNRLFLKTVEGLKPVDLVLRRVSSEMCDPLELRTDSLLGVPGLVQAAREGHVAIANALGSGLVESEALLSFLPGLCRFFFGESLQIPSVATWWCGQPKEKAYVIEHLDELVIRRVFSTPTLLAPSRDSVFGRDLDRTQRDALIADIKRDGYGFVGQELISPSRAPVWHGGGELRSAPMTLRVYLAATADGYRLMPGGLARASISSEPRTPWLEVGDLTKDTWVRWEGPVDTSSLFNQPHHALRLRRSGRDLPSRSADNLFWLGRYAERTEGAVRLLRSLLHRLGGDAGSSGDPLALERLASLLVVQGHISARRARAAVEEGKSAVERELWMILFDPDSTDGLAKVLGHVRRTAELVRERLSVDTWQILKELTETPHYWRFSQDSAIDDATRLLNRMIHHLAALNGMVMENMTRGYGWRFLDMGRRLERVWHTTRVIRALAVKEDDAAQGAGGLDLLLELADSAMTYRTRYKALPQLAPVLDLLLSDETNPRSAIFQLRAVEEHIRVLPEGEEDLPMGPVLRLVTGLTSDLVLADMVRLSEEVRRRGTRPGLDRLIRRLDTRTGELSDLIARSYFSHSLVQRTAGPRWQETGL